VKRLPALFVLAALLGCAGSEPAPAPGELIQPSAERANLFTTMLDNGLEVILIRDARAPLVTIEMAVRNGAFAETPQTNGLAHFYEHMFFKGNRSLPDQSAYLARTRELGIDFNGITSNEAVRYYFTLPSGNLEAGLHFMLDAVRFPSFNEDEIKTEIGAVLAEIDRAESVPSFRFHRAISDALFYEYPERKNVLGDRAVVQRVTPEVLRRIRARFYVPNNAALILSGDLEPAAALAAARKVFDDWPRAADPLAASAVPAHPPLTQPEQRILDLAEVQTATVRIVLQGPSVGRDPGATYAADVLSFILSQKNARFQKTLVDSGTCLRAGLAYYTLAHTGPIYLSALVEPGKVDAAVSALLAEIDRLGDPDYFSDEELQRAKTRLWVAEQFDREDTEEYALALGSWWCTTGIGYYLTYGERLRQVTRADIKAYLERYLIGKPRLVAVQVSQAAIDEHGIRFPGDGGPQAGVRSIGVEDPQTGIRPIGAGGPQAGVRSIGVEDPQTGIRPIGAGGPQAGARSAGCPREPLASVLPGPSCSDIASRRAGRRPADRPHTTEVQP